MQKLDLCQNFLKFWMPFRIFRPILNRFSDFCSNLVCERKPLVLDNSSYKENCIVILTVDTDRWHIEPWCLSYFIDEKIELWVFCSEMIQHGMMAQMSTITVKEMFCEEHSQSFPDKLFKKFELRKIIAEPSLLKRLSKQW